MPYDVKWRKAAIDEYGEILRSAPQLRLWLVDDGNRIDELLATDPISVATGDQDGLWITQVGRRRVLFAVE